MTLKSALIATILIPAALTLSACGETPETTTENVEVTQEASTYFEDEVRTVREGLYIAGQPSEIDIADFKNKGITHVFNFRTPKEMEDLEFDEQDLLRQSGISYTPIPIGGDDYPYSPEAVKQFTDAMKSSDGEVLLHCGSGYRASVVAVAWLVENEAMPLEEALTHAQGWWPLRLEQVMGTSFTLEMTE